MGGSEEEHEGKIPDNKTQRSEAMESLSQKLSLESGSERRDSASLDKQKFLNPLVEDTVGTEDVAVVAVAGDAEPDAATVRDTGSEGASSSQGADEGEGATGNTDSVGPLEVEDVGIITEEGEDHQPRAKPSSAEGRRAIINTDSIGSACTDDVDVDSLVRQSQSERLRQLEEEAAAKRASDAEHGGTSGRRAIINTDSIESNYKVDKIERFRATMVEQQTVEMPQLVQVESLQMAEDPIPEEEEEDSMAMEGEGEGEEQASYSGRITEARRQSSTESVKSVKYSWNPLTAEASEGEVEMTSLGGSDGFRKSTGGNGTNDLKPLPDALHQEQRRNGTLTNPLYDYHADKRNQQKHWVLRYLPKLEIHEIGGGGLMLFFVIFVMVCAENMWKNA
ncbi:hypothetical protein HOP50_05g35770 [Chloropicon primus]|uniref:Uncharacterized protein n=1 Tax=Chloropicon primus TaxID=1764295 RepID=A0A5B8MP01_9CHLO|nr:hypothetical protein A3770_05p35700 [Chloropicon primus]UPR00263.1 hypothetical protein HOP50_05g35770 [Chloropicon primus]|eukprot:QDZ21052.1 hypothetical protein A3770_05p35700 [Chloropicon primus]